MSDTVAICINTFRRPEQLRLTLASIAKLRLPLDQPPSLVVVVVNNDIASPIDHVIDDVRGTFPWILRSRPEPRRGIPQARNTAVRLAKELGANYFAFIDDDERVAPDWIEKIFGCAKRLDAPIVQGRVVPEFVAPPPAWAVAGTFFDGGRDERGLTAEQQLTHGATNNLLVRGDVFATVGYFDEWWTTQGGDDTEFTLRAGRFGFGIRWCPDAVVYEAIPAARVTRAWVLRRGFRSGNTYGLICRRLNKTWRAQILLVSVALVYVLRTGLNALFSLMASGVDRLKNQQEALFAVGTFAGACAYKFLEYERPFVDDHFRLQMERKDRSLANI